MGEVAGDAELERPLAIRRRVGLAKATGRQLGAEARDIGASLAARELGLELLAPGERERGRVDEDESAGRADLARDDSFRLGIERHVALVLGADRGHAAELARLRELRAIAQGKGAAGADEDRLLTLQMLRLLLEDGDVATATPLLDDARRAFAAAPDSDPQMRTVMIRVEAGFARLRGDFASAEREQGEAVTRYLAGHNPVKTAIARAELARIQASRGNAADARALLAQALPVLRDGVLPAQLDRVAAETLARQCGVPGKPAAVCNLQ